MRQERIQKFLARVGIAARRTIEQWITAGRIKVNGQLATLGAKVNGTEMFYLDDNLLDLGKDSKIEVRLLLYHKPSGELCSRSDPLQRSQVFDRLPSLDQGRWISVGRLDFSTSGLLLFTNSGDLAHNLMHPSFNLEREYLVRAHGKILPKTLNNMLDGVWLDDGLAKFKFVEITKSNQTNSWYKVILLEGKNREIKRLFASQGLTVNRLIRVRFGDWVLPRDLKPGEYIPITLQDVKVKTIKS